MKVWITKYALTQGIMESEGEPVADSTSRMLVCLGNRYFHNMEWHASKESAIDQAEEMRKRKLVSHLKSIKKLEKLRFEP